MGSLIDLTGYDFVDFGCSRGGAMNFVQRAYQADRGLGIDIDPVKVQAALNSGHHALVADLRRCELFHNKVRFSSLFHFLEHLPSMAEAIGCVRTACEISRDFVVIRQPWFDSDELLHAAGFKLYWSDWKCHSYHMTSSQLLELIRIMVELKLVHAYQVFGSLPLIADSSSPQIHPLASPSELADYDAAKHPPKSKTKFSFPVYHELQAVLATRKKMPLEEFRRLCEPLGKRVLLNDWSRMPWREPKNDQ